MTTFDQLIKHRRDFDVCQFADLDNEWHECSPVESFGLTALTFLLAISPVVAFIAFMVI